MESIKGFFNLFLVIIFTIIFNNSFSWYIAILLSLILVIVVPSFLSVYLQGRKLKNLPDVDKMPEEILNPNGVTSWEIEFCSDMKEKFKNEEFVEKITRKQCRKLVEVYLERVRKIPEKAIDVTQAVIHIGDRKIQ